MYQHFFGLRETAFAIAVNPRYLFMSEQHREALAHLLFGLKGGGFVQLTGEVGMGKTTVVRCLLEQLPENTDLALVLNPMASVPELLSSICDELGACYIDDAPTVKTLTDALYNRLLENHLAGRHTVLLIDEAQSLSTETLEQIRLLTNLETNTEKLLNIILVGQPELNQILAQPNLRQLAQRITARYHLEPLGGEETHAYIAHRLQVAGLEEGRELIPASVVAQVHEFSGGIPRLINIICERMLLGAYGRGQAQVNAQTFEQARKEIQGSAPAPEPEAPIAPKPGRRLRTWQTGLTAGIGGLLLGAALAFGLQPGSGDTPRPEVRLNDPVPALLTQGSDAPPSADTEPVANEPVDWPLALEPARRALADYLQLDVPERGSPCPDANEAGHHCRESELTAWNDLMALDRPAVLGLLTEARKRAYAPLLGLNEQQALLLIDGQPETLPWRDLAPLWDGRVYYFRFQPEEFDRPLTSGYRGPTVTWLAERFAELDREERPLAREQYNQPLQARVAIFQRQQDLEEDGVFGPGTLARLNRVLGLDPGLADPGKEWTNTAVAEDWTRKEP